MLRRLRDHLVDLPRLRLLQAVVEDAIALRARCISFGRTALEPKARLGAGPHGLRCFVPEPDLPPERNPFKEA
ncbi:MAG TPA: hypothetical protein VEO54_29410 [Thermoanaerobaculia bacterium]|nr:hypothetical protein [Thermoanaerobaculia bacterium]